MEPCLVCIVILFSILCMMCELLDYSKIEKLFLLVGVENGIKFMWFTGSIIFIIFFLVIYINNKVL